MAAISSLPLVLVSRDKNCEPARLRVNKWQLGTFPAHPQQHTPAAPVPHRFRAKPLAPQWWIPRACKTPANSRCFACQNGPWRGCPLPFSDHIAELGRMPCQYTALQASRTTSTDPRHHTRRPRSEKDFRAQHSCRPAVLLVTDPWPGQWKWPNMAESGHPAGTCRPEMARTAAGIGPKAASVGHSPSRRRWLGPRQRPAKCERRQ